MGIQICVHSKLYGYFKSVGQQNLWVLKNVGIKRKCGYSIYVGIQICPYSKLYGYLKFVGKKNMWVVKNVGIQKLWVFNVCGYSNLCVLETILRICG